MDVCSPIAPQLDPSPLPIIHHRGRNGRDHLLPGTNDIHPPQQDLHYYLSHHAYPNILPQRLHHHQIYAGIYYRSRDSLHDVLPAPDVVRRAECDLQRYLGYHLDHFFLSRRLHHNDFCGAANIEICEFDRLLSSSFDWL